MGLIQQFKIWKHLFMASEKNMLQWHVDPMSAIHLGSVMVQICSGLSGVLQAKDKLIIHVSQDPWCQKTKANYACAPAGKGPDPEIVCFCSTRKEPWENFVTIWYQ